LAASAETGDGENKMTSHMTAANTPVPVYGTIDPTDVPVVAVRELATALKVLAGDVASLARAAEWSEDDFRRVEQFFWQRFPRDRQRKIAALVRLRSLVAVCKARRMQKLISEHGAAAAQAIVEAAASMRLNTSFGFSPVKVSCAVIDALKDPQTGLVRGVAAA
jgi:hypothetical protein